MVKLEKIRRALQAMYTGRCTVVERQEYEEGSLTKFREVPVLENQPCRLSFGTAPAAGMPEGAAPLKQTVKLFVAPDLTVKPGSKLIVEQNGFVTEYKGSGVPARYPTHQEITLDLFERWT